MQPCFALTIIIINCKLFLLIITMVKGKCKICTYQPKIFYSLKSCANYNSILYLVFILMILEIIQIYIHCDKHQLCMFKLQLSIYVKAEIIALIKEFRRQHILWRHMLCRSCGFNNFCLGPMEMKTIRDWSFVNVWYSPKDAAMRC